MDDMLAGSEDITLLDITIDDIVRPKIETDETGFMINSTFLEFLPEMPYVELRAWLMKGVV